MVTSERIHLNTRGNNDIIDISGWVSQAVAKSGLRNGIVAIAVLGSTASVTTMEYEPGLVSDMQRLLERLAPAGVHYSHNERWGDDNGHSHLRASLLGPSIVVPFSNGRLDVGTWQQIVLIDFDIRPRSRDILIQVLGE